MSQSSGTRAGDLPVTPRYVIPLLAFLAALYVVSQIDYVVFRGLVELFSVAVMWGVFLLVWNTRRIARNDALLFLGVAFLFAGTVNLVHMVCHADTGLFEADCLLEHAAQLLVATRGMEAVSLLLFGLFLGRRVAITPVLAGYAVVTVLLLLAVFSWDLFPAGYTEAGQLTGSMALSRYSFAPVLAVAGVLLVVKGRVLPFDVRALLVMAVAATLLGEILSLTHYAVHGTWNDIASYLMRAVFVLLLYLALIRPTLKRPYANLFQELEKERRALRDSETALRTLVDGIPDIVKRFDRAGRHLFVSDSVTEYPEHPPPEESVGKTYRELGFDEPMSVFRETAIRQVYDTGTSLETEFVVEHSGSKRAFNWRLYPERDSEGRVASVLSLTREVTFQRRFEQEYHSLFHQMVMGFAVHEVVRDDDGKVVDYRFLDVNPAFSRITGLPEHEVLGRTALEVLPDLDLSWIEIYGRVATTGEVATFEKYSTPLKKHFQVAAFRTGPDRFACNFIDVTDRRRLEGELKASEERYRTLVESAGVSVVVAREQRFVYVNPKTVEMLGFTAEELLSRSFVSFIHPEDREEAWAEYEFRQKSGESGAPGAPYSMRLITAEGETRWVDVNGMPISWDGAPALLFFVADTTERKQMEIQRERMRDRLEEAHNLESIGRLAGGVAHEVNNSLAVILDHAELAMDELETGSPVRESLQEIQDAARRSASFTGQLLTFACRQPTAPEVLDLNRCMQDMQEMLRRLIGEHIDLVWRPGTDLWPVKMDPGYLAMILMNICANSRDAIEGSGQIVIQTHNQTLDDAYCSQHPGAVAGDYVRLLISDDGAGMDREVLEHLFEPFYTTKAEDQVTGLGLAAAHGAVKQTGGFIAVYSEPGFGTTFKIYLPRHREPEAGESAEPLQEKECRGSGTILLVEDEAGIVRVTTKMLEGMGYKVLAARSPREAIQLAREYPERIDLLVTDVVMPDMSGRDLAGILQSERTDMAIIYMSGYSADIIADQQVLPAGVNFLPKPFSIEALRTMVSQALNEASRQHPGCLPD